MGGAAGLASGIIGGLIAGKQYQDRQAADKKWDDRMAKILDRNGGSAPTQSDDQLQASLSSGPSAGSPQMMERTDENVAALNAGYADGGVVSQAAPLPMYGDRMSWQRQSFKKGADPMGVVIIEVK